MSRFFEELKRRNVVKVGIAYLVAAWLLLQITDVLVPVLTLPAWTARFIFLLLLVGFVPALIFAWAYELTPSGLRRESDVDRSSSSGNFAGRKLNYAIITLLSLAIVYLALDNYVFADPPAPAAAVQLEKSIAVLPFRNRSDNDADVHFVDGIHDDILTQLTKLSALDKVISRTSSERYRDTELSIPQIGAELGVATILEGGVQRAGNRVRINIQLIDASTDEHLWANSYDRELTVDNLFAIQSEIAREIVSSLHGVLTDSEAEQLEKLPTTSLEAHAEYAFGRRELAKRTGQGIDRAQTHFAKAVELDPNYALAWVGLAQSRLLRFGYLGEPLESTWAGTQAAIDRALSLDPLLGEAYATLAFLRYTQESFDEAEELYAKAIDLNPNDPLARLWYTTLLLRTNRTAEAEAHIRKAIELDPAAPVLRQRHVYVLLSLGRLEDARAAALAGVKRNPEFPGLYDLMSGILRADGQYGDALRWMQEAARLNPTSASSRASVCGRYLELEDLDAAEACVDAYEKEMPESSPFLRAHLLGAKGQTDEARALVDKLVEEGLSMFDKPRAAESYFFVGEPELAREFLEETHPEFFGNDPWNPSQAHDLYFGILSASTLYYDGELERANYLFDQALFAMQAFPRSGPSGYHDNDVLIHVVRGDKEKAIAALRAAFEEDAVFASGKYRAAPFASMLDEPEWLALIDEISAEFKREREWYEAHKDEPLF
jgi:TolB-like protein/Flp pilus assembly protein TadD